MPYTSDPAGTPSDTVRFLVGDTSLTNPDLDDSEIVYLLADEGDDPRRAAARAAEALSAKYTKYAEERRVGPLTIRTQMVTKSKQFADLAKVLWARAARGSMVGPYAGGVSLSDKAANEADADRASTAITRNLMPYPTGDPGLKAVER